MQMELIIRFDYGCGHAVGQAPRRRRLTAVAGPDRLTLAPPSKRGASTCGPSREFTVGDGEEVPFPLTWSPSFKPRPRRRLGAATRSRRRPKVWREWANSYKPEGSGQWSEAVLRSLITLEGADPPRDRRHRRGATTSLPEQLGGPRNWDYRFCWLRDATLTLYSLMNSGFTKRRRLGAIGCCARSPGARRRCRSCTASPASAGLPEYEVTWLHGYEGAGAGAHRQCRFRSAATRCLWRGARCAVPGRGAWVWRRAKPPGISSGR